MVGRIFGARDILLDYHNSELTDLVYNTLLNEFYNVDPNKNYWDRIVEVLNSKNPYTLCIGGDKKLVEGTTSSTFPNVLITNQLTNSHIPSVEQNTQAEAYILAFGKDSFQFSEIGNIKKVEPAVEPHSTIQGVDIEYSGNKKLRSYDANSDSVKKLSISGETSSGFYISHNNTSPIYKLSEITPELIS